MEFKHEPIMLNECIENLNIKKDGIYVDGTMGGAGHSSKIVEKLDGGLLIGIDRDQEAIEASKKRLAKYSNVKYVHGRHEDIISYLKSLGIEKVDGVLHFFANVTVQVVKEKPQEPLMRALEQKINIEKTTRK